jgi:hypothetical protein
MTNNQPYSVDPKIRNRERAQDAEAALVAYFAIKNPGVCEMDPDSEGRDTLVDLLSDLRHWARWRDEDYASADAMSASHFADEVADETTNLKGENHD